MGDALRGRMSENKDIDVARVCLGPARERAKNTYPSDVGKSGFENTGAAAARSELRVGETLVFESSMYRRADGKRALSGRRGRQASVSALRTARLMR